jgi:DNA-binding transcriptional LysR family regulator
MRKAGVIDLRSIRYLVAIIDEGTFARAAEKLNVTQPALSRSVQALERALGVKLLDRGKSGATPTVFGKVLTERGRRLLSDSDAIAREIALLGGAEAGALSIGAGTYPAEVCVGAAAARLLTQRPGLDLRITIGDWPDLTEAVLAEEIDLAICDVASAEANPRLCVELLPAHQGVLFCRAGHPLTTRTSLSFDDVREFPLALTALPDRLGSRFRPDEMLEGKAVAPQVHVDTFQLAREIVLQSDVVGGALAIQITDDLRTGRAVVLALDLPWFTTRYGFIYRAGRTLAPSLRLFMSQVRAVEHEIAAKLTTPRGSKPPRSRGKRTKGRS